LFGAGLAVAGLIGPLLGGCSDLYYDRRQTIALSTGNALAANQVGQMVDPWPREAAQKEIAFNGERMQAAVERYRQNRVTPPVNATTSSVAYQQAQAAAASATSATQTTTTVTPAAGAPSP
jgi:hypothetical protein